MKSKNWPNNKYYEYDRATIKAIWDTNRDSAASAGTKMHYDIECYYNNCPNENESIEYKYFKNFHFFKKFLALQSLLFLLRD